jgi:hypothetical protein
MCANLGIIMGVNVAEARGRTTIATRRVNATMMETIAMMRALLGVIVGVNVAEVRGRMTIATRRVNVMTLVPLPIKVGALRNAEDVIRREGVRTPLLSLVTRVLI